MTDRDHATRPRRSSLVVPASSPRMIEKAAAAGADEVVLDLEDSVVEDEKAAARANACAALASVDFGSALVTVRINDATTRHCFRDVVALVAEGGERLDCLMVPKADAPSQLHFVDGLLAGVEAETGRARPVGLVIQIESARGAVTLGATAAASGRIAAIAFGPADYAADLGLAQLEIGATAEDFPGHQWQWPMSIVANHARAIDAQAIDGPCGDFHDQAAFARSARIAALLGYEGKHCIHPRQVAWANAAFTPTAAQVERAREVLAAVERAAAGGSGAAALDGRMIDEASRRAARRLLARVPAG